MLETGYKAPNWNARRIAHGYQDGRDWGTIVDRIAVDGAPYWELRGNGGLHTTLGDMARWDAALANRSVLTDSSRTKFMTGLRQRGARRSLEVRLRLGGDEDVARHAAGHAQWRQRVYVAEFLRFVDDRVTIFVTSTVSELTATTAVRVVSRIVFGQPYELPPARVAAAPAAVAAAAGTYLLADGSRLLLRADDGRLMAEAVGQQAYALLATGDTASAPEATTLNARSRAIAEAVMNGDVTLLRTALGPGGPDSAEVASQEAGLLEGRLQRFGAFRSVEVLGTVRGPEGGLQTTVRLNFERGGATNIYTWDRGGHIMDIGARPFAAVELLPSGNGEFRSFDARSGGGARFSFAAGKATALTPRGPVTLVRP